MSLCIAPIADLSASDTVLLSWECTATGRLSLALSDSPPRSATVFSQGNPRGDYGKVDRDAWAAATGLTFPSAVSTHAEAALWLHTGLADPAGIDAPLPLGPTSEGRYELWMGGEAAFVLDANSARYAQAISAAKARQKSMQLRKIKAMVAARDVEAIKDAVGKFGMAKLRNYLGGRPLGRDWQNKAQQLLDQWLDGETELKRAIRAKFPNTEVTEDGSSGSGVWTEVTSGFVATDWSFSAGTISCSPTSATSGRMTFQRYGNPFSSDDSFVELNLAATTAAAGMLPFTRVDNAASLNGYGAQKSNTTNGFLVAESNASSLANIGAITTTPTSVTAGDIIGIYSNGTTHTITYLSGSNGYAHSVTDSTHQGVDHVYVGIGAVGITSSASEIARISQMFAADLFAAAASGGGPIIGGSILRG